MGSVNVGMMDGKALDLVKMMNMEDPDVFGVHDTALAWVYKMLLVQAGLNGRSNEVGRLVP